MLQGDARYGLAAAQNGAAIAGTVLGLGQGTQTTGGRKDAVGKARGAPHPLPQTGRRLHHRGSPVAGQLEVHLGLHQLHILAAQLLVHHLFAPRNGGDGQEVRILGKVIQVGAALGQGTPVDGLQVVAIRVGGRLHGDGVLIGTIVDGIAGGRLRGGNQAGEQSHMRFKGRLQTLLVRQTGRGSLVARSGPRKYPSQPVYQASLGLRGLLVG